MDESALRPYSRACSRHLPAGDAKKDPEIHLGKRFASPVKKDHPRAKRAKSRESVKELAELRMKSPAISPSSSRSATPAPSAQSTSHSACSTPSTVPVREPPSDTEVLVNTALLARIEALEAENSEKDGWNGAKAATVPVGTGQT
jgi:hypothetical protein